ncbi:hypothetical protein ACLBKU_12175 [Erythrobacter sp. NE805]|uniref:hypothetical protein n=1 Tax=Erythrobacter sp. NE805 TaxID=3389875 RepID=UPI00396B26A6
MTGILSRLTAVTIAIGLGLGGPTNSQAAGRIERETYRHCDTGILFPSDLGGLARASMNIQDPSKCFLHGIRYLVPGLRGSATIRISPGGGERCIARFAKEDERMRAVWWHREPRLNGEPLRLLGSDVQQHTARYTDGENIGGRHQRPETNLTLWVGCIGPGRGETATWVVRYESDFEAADEAKVADLPQKLFAAIDWSPIAAK